MSTQYPAGDAIPPSPPPAPPTRAELAYPEPEPRPQPPALAYAGGAGWSQEPSHPFGNPAALREAAYAWTTMATWLAEVADGVEAAGRQVTSRWEGAARQEFHSVVSELSAAAGAAGRQARQAGDLLEEAAAAVDEANQQFVQWMAELAITGVLVALTWGVGGPVIAGVRGATTAARGARGAGLLGRLAAIRAQLATRLARIAGSLDVLAARFATGLLTSWAQTAAGKLQSGEEWTRQDVGKVLLTGAWTTIGGSLAYATRSGRMLAGSHPIATAGTVAAASNAAATVHGEVLVEGRPLRELRNPRDVVVVLSNAIVAGLSSGTVAGVFKRTPLPSRVAEELAPAIDPATALGDRPTQAVDGWIERPQPATATPTSDPGPPPAPEQPPATSPASPPAPASEQVPGAAHTVAPGESLWTIAQDRYGDPSGWGAIWRANPGIDDPARLVPGRVLRIPPPGSPG